VEYVKAKAHTTVPRADVAWMETVEPGEVIRVADLPGWFAKKLTDDPWTRELFEPATAAEFAEWVGEEGELESEPMPVVAARQAAVQQAADEQAERAQKRGPGRPRKDAAAPAVTG
jgi:hypothetical protein